jgi:WD40 repeat protein
MFRIYCPILACIGFIYFSQSVSILPSASARDDRLLVAALTPGQIRERAARFVVRIDGGGRGNGTGFIINKTGNTYTVLTNEHVVRSSNGQSLTTGDGKTHSFNASNVRVFSGIDLAEITFTSDATYEVAKLKEGLSLELGTTIYCYGWNAIQRPIYPVRAPRWESGTLRQTLPVENSLNGYSLVFNFSVVPGLSGSPVLDENGEVIGVYGLSEEENSSSTLGVSIATYQRYVNTARVPSVPVSPAQAAPPSVSVTPATNNIFRRLYSRSEHTKPVLGVAISPDGKIVVSGSADNTIKVWDLASGRLLRTIEPHSSWIFSVAISPDGKNIVSGNWDNTIDIWQIEDGKRLRSLNGHKDSVTSVAISPDGKTIVSGSKDRTIKIWNIADGNLQQTLTGHTNSINSVAISSDGKTIISGSEDRTISTWQIGDGKRLLNLTGHEDIVTSVAISPDGKTIVSGSKDRTVSVWGSADGQRLRTIPHAYSVLAVAISPDGKTIFSGSSDRTIKAWQLTDGKPIQVLSSDWVVTSVAISPDGQTILSGSGDRAIDVWRFIP